MKKNSNGIPERTIGIDLGDRKSHWCLIDRAGEVKDSGVAPTNLNSFRKVFGTMLKARVVIENGTHARWVWRLLHEMGHEVIVANTHKVKLISQNNRKRDRVDAEYLARLGRMDVKLLCPIHFRGEQAHADRCLLRARHGLVKARSMLISQIRGMVKAFGGRIGRFSAESFGHKAGAQIPPPLQGALGPLLESIQYLTEKIRSYEQQIASLNRARYPESQRIEQVTGVGPITALAYVVTLEDPSRFARSRDVGPYLGMTPKMDESGDRSPQLRITRAGDGYLRWLLVNCAQYILGPFGPDSDLRRHGQKIAARGGKNAKKRAVVAVARKLAVLLHRLWVSGAVYDPLYNSKRQEQSHAA